MNTFHFFKKTAQIILPIFMLAGLGCATSSDDQPSINNISQTLTGSDWKVTWYWDKDKDETNDFSGYTFHFNNDGTFESSTTGVTTTGTWQITSNDGSQRLVLSSGSATKPFSDLDDDWIITNQTDSQIKLKDDNAEHLEELFFENT